MVPEAVVQQVGGQALPRRREEARRQADVAFIEEQRVVRAILVRLSLWDEARPPPATSAATPRAPAELEYLPWVE